MNRCIELAKNGLGTTYPNPLVGSLIVFEDQIIGEGWHYESGKPHAEVNAVNRVRDKNLLHKSTMYVSLEPCSHFGKTPPCVDLILKHKIPNVIIGTVDPNEKVSGKSIKKLQDAGVNVVCGVLERECQELNRRFFTFQIKKRPFIILKWAESADGFLAPKEKNERKPVWLSNPISRQLVHKWRTEENGILVGKQTVIEDNPKLSSRDWYGNQPSRITFDGNNSIPKESYFFDNELNTFFFTKKSNSVSSEKTTYIELDFSDKNLSLILENLYKKNIQSVIIEGGAKTLNNFIEIDLWDEARIFRSENLLNDGIKSPDLKKTPDHLIKIGSDKLYFYYNHD